MRREVYLLSIPLTRHRTIVPRAGRSAFWPQGSGMPGPEQPTTRVAETAIQSRAYPGISQRTDPG